MRLTRRGMMGAAASLAGCSWLPPSPPPGSAAVALPPVALAGPLASMGGLDIDNARLGAGGLSAVHVGDDLVVTVLDDRARWAQARLVLEDGAPTALQPLGAGPLGDGAGRPLPPGYAGDAESLARLPDGRWLVGFERWHRIRAYPRLDGPGAYVEAPPGLERAQANGGIESLALLADGRMFAIAERAARGEPADLRRAWIGAPGAWVPVTWRPAGGFGPVERFGPVDAAGLPDGGALVLERRFSWLGGFAARLMRVPEAALRAAGPGAVLEGEEILRLDGAMLPAENWEGVATFSHGGRDFVALVSDDNHSLAQRSMLLLFAWRG